MPEKTIHGLRSRLNSAVQLTWDGMQSNAHHALDFGTGLLLAIADRGIGSSIQSARGR